MRFSIRCNNDLSLPEYRSLAAAAEEAGFDQFWLSNDLFLRSAPVVLAALAADTTRIELGTGILNPYTQHPAEIAMMAATLDEVTGNRFNLGIAAGAGEFFKWVGIEQTRPLRMMRETIACIRALLRGERVSFHGDLLHWSEESYLRFTPQRVTPIYLGAMSPGMLRLAGECADGVLPLLFPPETYSSVGSLIAEGEATRDPTLAPLDYAACVWVSLDPDRASARHALAAKVAYYGHALSPSIYEALGVPLEEFRPIERALMIERDEPKAISMVTDQMLRIGIVGNLDDVVDRLMPLVRSGAKHISFGPPLGPDPLRSVPLFADVISRMRAAAAES